MEFGDKLDILKERSGCKNFADFGKKLGIPGDWILDLRKRKDFKAVNLERIMIIAEYFNITIDELLKDDKGDSFINLKEGLPEDDIGVQLEKIQSKLKDSSNTFDGIIMNEEVSQLAIDSIGIVKQLIKNNL